MKIWPRNLPVADDNKDVAITTPILLAHCNGMQVNAGLIQRNDDSNRQYVLCYRVFIN